ncbi:RNA recognition motif domain-containing protein [Alteromonas sp. a30]|uniref:RNA recognition motif domain-containing protein n=1 Tax=Alteromonas sp. a30 TaxID=2730917 RepID=UPI00228329F9|nr:RNA-binding protein [Alteromonas sp. a30]MCY7296560.1 RNA-binding protein [Alteromonas sp. a30]
MNSPLIKDVSVSIILAIIGYFVVGQLFPEADNPQLFLAVGLLIGGVVVSLLHLSNKGSDDSNEETQETTTLYVGNLAYRVNEAAVREHFSKVGNVRSVRLMQDKRTGKKKGFGFVEVDSDDADKMISTYNDTQFNDRTLKVRLAKERKTEN